MDHDILGFDHWPYTTGLPLDGRGPCWFEQQKQVADISLAPSLFEHRQNMNL
jgi:hypothetical protein